MSNRNQRPSNFPPDLAAVFAPYWLLLPILLISSQLWNWTRAAMADGDTAVLWIAVSLGATGSVFLFFARLPLYRRKQFFQIGPRGLDPAHLRLYYQAYILIAVSVGMLSLLMFAAA